MPENEVTPIIITCFVYFFSGCLEHEAKQILKVKHVSVAVQNFSRGSVHSPMR